VLVCEVFALDLGTVSALDLGWVVGCVDAMGEEVKRTELDLYISLCSRIILS